MKEPEINVGIVNALEIAFTLNAKFLAKEKPYRASNVYPSTKEEFPGTETCTGS